MAKKQFDQVNAGGLMRCCTETINDLYPDGPANLATQGQILHCKYCKERMSFNSGWWSWCRPESVTP